MTSQVSGLSSHPKLGDFVVIIKRNGPSISKLSEAFALEISTIFNVERRLQLSSFILQESRISLLQIITMILQVSVAIESPQNGDFVICDHAIKETSIDFQVSRGICGGAIDHL